MSLSILRYTVIRANLLSFGVFNGRQTVGCSTVLNSQPELIGRKTKSLKILLNAITFFTVLTGGGCCYQNVANCLKAAVSEPPILTTMLSAFITIPIFYSFIPTTQYRKAAA